MAGLLRISFQNFAIRMTGINNAFAYNIQAAVMGTYPSFSIDYSLALVSRGDLPNALTPAVTLSAGNVLSFGWTDNTGAGIAQATDQAIVVAYCPGLRQSVYTTSGGTRSSVTGDLDASQFAGQTVQTWIGFISENGQKVATSIFTGEVPLIV
jgi:hypothetical protein